VKYTRLNQDQQRQMLENRIAGLEAEHYNHSINIQLLEASGDTSDAVKAQVKVSREAMQIIEDAHSEVAALLENISGDPEVPGRPAPNRAERRAKSGKSSNTKG
jgi:hypothetical protein